MSDHAMDLTKLRTLRPAREVIEMRVKEAELDGFLAAYFLNRYEGEKRRVDLSPKLSTLRDAYTFTRGNVAMLGVALERGWIPATPATAQRFVEGYERLERQQPGTEVVFQESLKLLWGVALGGISPCVTALRPDLPRRLFDIVSDFRIRSRGCPRDYIFSTAILADLNASQRQTLGRDLTYYLLGLNASELADGDVLAALWAIRQRCFAPRSASELEPELLTFYKRVLPRLFRLTRVEDILDALLADYLYAEVIRESATGFGLANDALSVVLRVFDTFPELVRRLRERKQGKPPFHIDDEYDVHDLLYVALKPHLHDLSDEEWTPKDAGGAKRIDFVSKAARICLEAKKPRDRNHAKKIADELKIDIESYYLHEACDKLAILVYDADEYMADASQQEEQLSGPRTIKGRSVDVVVRIRPH